jgi:hypothetical protein
MLVDFQAKIPQNHRHGTWRLCEPAVRHSFPGDSFVVLFLIFFRSLIRLFKFLAFDLLQL